MDESFLKQLNKSVWKKKSPYFLYVVYIAHRKSEPSFSSSFLAVIPLLVMH